MGRSNYTGLLYAQPTMLSGIARILDMGGTFDQYNDSPTTTEADWIALASDWYAISDDFIRVVGAAESKLGDESIDAAESDDDFSAIGPAAETMSIETDPKSMTPSSGVTVVPEEGVRHVRYSESFEAHFSPVPMPAPGPLERLQALYPDAPRIIFEQWQNQVAHREKIEAAVIETNNKLALRGQWFAAYSATLLIVGSFVVIGLGYPTAGATVALGTTGGLIALFITGRRSQQEEREAKAKIRAKIAKGEPPETLLNEAEAEKPRDIAKKPGRAPARRQTDKKGSGAEPPKKGQG